ncbi:hypothetical protein [Streptomyces sp. KL116D]|uniref:hypothetical protein n=1 Tax=Streptomyces sp. KL116D TaxID=3045152 RepID=UPI003556522C
MTPAASPDGDSPEEEAFWPFLICRGHRVGFTVVAAPDFLVAARLPGLLFDVAGGDPTGAGRARYRLVTGTPVGDLLVMFTVRKANTSHLGVDAPPGAPLLDEHSRQVPLIEGVVGRAAGLAPDSGDGPLMAGRDVCLPLFVDFWNADTEQEPTATETFRMDRRAGAAVDWESRDAGPRVPRASPRRTETSVPKGPAAPPPAVRDAGPLGRLLRKLFGWALKD